jgi:hypothetical protein
MRYIVDIKEASVNSINKLINEGKYKNMVEFINVAIENQIYIEYTDINEVAEPVKYYSSLSHDKTSKTENLNHFDSTKKMSYSKILTVPMPEINHTSLVVNNNHLKSIWLWGQINKILPIKIGLRSLVNMVNEEGWTDFENFREFATNNALNISENLRRYEESLKKKREERISTGLPTKEKYKSSDRYKYHFLAFLRNDELIDGALGVLRFINFKKEDKKVLIGITQQGLKFAQLDNPVLDNNNFDRSLSEQEIDFYLRHTQKYVVNEWNAICWLIGKIGMNGTKREIINSEIEKEFQHKWECSIEYINTQRAGLMSRMNELGLIETVKSGIYVTYHLSKIGSEISMKTKYYENE